MSDVEKRLPPAKELPIKVGTTILMTMSVHKRISPAKTPTEKVWVLCSAKVIKVDDAGTVVVKATYDDWGETRTHMKVTTQEAIRALKIGGGVF